MFAFKRLDSGQLIGAHRSFSLLSPPGSLLIDRTYLFDRFLSLRIVRGCQPVTDQMELEIPFFSSRAA